ncbi:MAG: transketolase, partial [Erysipelotrichaceae bacterium]|nr:transketolase [Erysipelotrichaceae bacterium]
MIVDKISLKNHAKNIRKNIVKMVANANSGHIGGALSATDILTVLYFNEMNIQAENVGGVNRDR